MEDAEALHWILGDEAVMEYMEEPFDLPKTRRFLSQFAAVETPLVYALEWKADGRLIGHVIFHAYGQNDREIGWVLHPDFWGMGIASEVTAALIDEAREQCAAGCVIECVPQQKASCRIAEKFGFQQAGCGDGCLVFRLPLS